MDQSALDTLMLILQWLFTIVGASSAIVAALIPIAKLTPTSKDDEFLSGAQKFLAWLISILDRLAINPDQSKARKPK
ncbi:hypothetical protein [Vibrio phage vB_VpaM_XM1]